jgi:ribonuclease VapC
MIVVDTSALIAILLIESDAPLLAARLANATAVSVSGVTVLEAGMVVWARFGASGLVDLRRLLASVNAVVVPFDGTLADIAIHAFATFGRGSGAPAKLNFGDCASYALAKSLGAPLLYKGNDFAATDIVSAV